MLEQTNLFLEKTAKLNAPAAGCNDESQRVLPAVKEQFSVSENEEKICSDGQVSKNLFLEGKNHRQEEDRQQQ